MFTSHIHCDKMIYFRLAGGQVIQDDPGKWRSGRLQEDEYKVTILRDVIHTESFLR